jgi:hypothetical protein
MKLPWVSEWRLLAAEAERDRALSSLADMTAKYDRLLLDHLAYLRPVPVVTLPKAALPTKEKDALLVLAAERGGRDAGLRRALSAYVQKQRAAGVDDERIADEITHWRDPEDEDDTA